MLILISFLSCTNSRTVENVLEEPSAEVTKETEDDMIALINQSFDEREMDSKIAEMKSENERVVSEAWKAYYEEFFIAPWLYGTWEYSGFDEYVGRFTMYVIITEDNLKWGYNGSISYNGPYEIDEESNQIIINRHNGYYTSISFNPQTERLLYENGHYFTKVNDSKAQQSSHLDSNHSKSNSSSSYSSKNGNNSSTVRFCSDADVISYTSSHIFKNSNGNKIKITFQGLYSNGNLITNAPRVLSFSGSSATISVSSPYNGGGAMYIRVDASQGTITDGSGDVFKMVD